MFETLVIHVEMRMMRDENIEMKIIEVYWYVEHKHEISAKKSWSGRRGVVSQKHGFDNREETRIKTFTFPVRIEIVADSGLKRNYRFSSTTVGLLKCPLVITQYKRTSAAVLASE